MGNVRRPRGKRARTTLAAMNRLELSTARATATIWLWALREKLPARV